MRREDILGILFWSGVWGFSEATLGNALYRAAVPHASVFLTAVAFVILTMARAGAPRPGTATLIALLAMLYKLLNAPFFACHLLGIALTGLCYDVFLSTFRIKRVWLAAMLAVWASYATFALLITYVARYPHWVQGGIARVLEHVGISGSMAALACAFVVPLTLRLRETLRPATPRRLDWRTTVFPAGVAVVTAGLWVLGIAIYLLNHAPRG